jgi:hypothetical protein
MSATGFKDMRGVKNFRKDSGRGLTKTETRLS